MGRHWESIKARLKLMFIGPCDFPDRNCLNAGSAMYFPHENSRPVFVCNLHKLVLTHRDH